MSKRGLTAKQREVLDVIQGRTDHPTAEELYRTLREQGSRTSLATVYRALRTLAEDGLVAEVRGLGADRFDPVPSAHYHFVCTQCDRVYDADIPYQDGLDLLLHQTGFQVSGHEVTFFGTCSACSNPKEEKAWPR
ncbi:transcriptional repressor [Candidatus Bipolaricaulota bacterium]|nr:transcriptional repressor [Candidatus Bipolaricaulota bacterium]